MTTRDDSAPALSELTDVLETFGGDPRRWPEARRSRLLRLIDSNPDARAHYRDAVALDKVLDHAPSARPERLLALVDQIVAKAQSQPRLITSEPVVAVETPAPLSVDGLRPSPRRETKRQERNVAALALAASLVLGLLIGQNSSVAPTMMALVADEPSVSVASNQTNAWFEDAISGNEEDIL